MLIEWQFSVDRISNDLQLNTFYVYSHTLYHQYKADLIFVTLFPNFVISQCDSLTSNLQPDSLTPYLQTDFLTLNLQPYSYTPNLQPDSLTPNLQPDSLTSNLQLDFF